ncbi:hypothetical protein ZIOFF_057276 [Zingiber officinale]|uniref:Uncharacterized protein n=1 Tax=Zingiber officinale TaxID=94328 RepID=A0A8J5KBN4_ZINOF|nr:hypothetical protein ZIOFF_057276 [Zingiber officinale]
MCSFDRERGQGEHHGRHESKSFRDWMMQLDVYNNRLAVAPPLGLPDFRSYGASYTYSYKGGGGYDLDDFKSKPDRGSSSSSNKGSDRWSFSDPDFQQKRQVIGYKAYSVGAR